MKKIVSVLLAAALVLSLFAIPAMAAQDVEIDLSTIAQAKAEYDAHGFPGQSCIMYDYGLVVNLGSFNLADYSAIEVSYATDKGFIAKKDGMTQISCFAIMNENTTIGQATDPTYSNEDKIIAKADCADAEVLNPDAANWGQNERTATINLAGSTFNGDIYLVHFNSTENQALVTGVKLIAKTSGGDNTSAPTAEPTTKPTNQPDNPKAGDSSMLLFAAAAALVTVTFVSIVFKKKRV